MDRAAVKALSRRRAQALSQMVEAASADEPDFPRVRQLLDEVKAINDVRALGLDPWRQRAAQAIAFACIALILVALSLVIHVGGKSVSVQADSDAMSFSLGPASELKTPGIDLRSVTAAAVTVDGKFEMEPDLSGMTSLTEIRATGGAAGVEFNRTRSHCFALRTPRGSLELELAGGSIDSLLGRTVGLDSRGTLELCPSTASRMAVKNPGGIRFATLWEETTPPSFLPSIRAGLLEFPTSGISRRLRSDQRIELEGTSGSLLIAFEDSLSAAFSGRAEAVRQFSAFGPQSDGKTLTPTLAETILSSPVAASVIAALAGVWGFLWSLSRLFSRA